MSEALNEFSKEVVVLHNNTTLKITYGKGRQQQRLVQLCNQQLSEWLLFRFN